MAQANEDSIDISKVQLQNSSVFGFIDEEDEIQEEISPREPTAPTSSEESAKSSKIFEPDDAITSQSNADRKKDEQKWLEKQVLRSEKDASDSETAPNLTPSDKDPQHPETTPKKTAGNELAIESDSELDPLQKPADGSYDSKVEVADSQKSNFSPSGAHFRASSDKNEAKSKTEGKNEGHAEGENEGHANKNETEAPEKLRIVSEPAPTPEVPAKPRMPQSFLDEVYVPDDMLLLLYNVLPENTPVLDAIAEDWGAAQDADAVELEGTDLVFPLRFTSEDSTNPILVRLVRIPRMATGKSWKLAEVDGVGNSLQIDEMPTGNGQTDQET